MGTRSVRGWFFGTSCGLLDRSTLSCTRGGERQRSAVPMSQTQPAENLKLRTLIGRAPDRVLEEERGRVEFWRAYERFVIYSGSGHLTGKAVRWATSSMTRVANEMAPKKIYIAWDISRQTGYETKTRTSAASWFVQGGIGRTHRFILLLPPSPMIRMAARVSLAIAGSSDFVFDKEERFLKAVEDTMNFLRDKTLYG